MTHLIAIVDNQQDLVYILFVLNFIFIISRSRKNDTGNVGLNALCMILFNKCKTRVLKTLDRDKGSLRRLFIVFADEYVKILVN